jgi:hypothetical protein
MLSAAGRVASVEADAIPLMSVELLPLQERKHSDA